MIEREDPTYGPEVAAAALKGESQGPGAIAGARAAGSTRAMTQAPGRMGRRNGHTTSGLDVALSALADRLHPVG
jgi:hypothetical protein